MRRKEVRSEESAGSFEGKGRNRPPERQQEVFSSRFSIDSRLMVIAHCRAPSPPSPGSATSSSSPLKQQPPRSLSSGLHHPGGKGLEERRLGRGGLRCPESFCLPVSLCTPTFGSRSLRSDSLTQRRGGSYSSRLTVFMLAPSLPPPLSGSVRVWERCISTGPGVVMAFPSSAMVDKAAAHRPPNE